MYIKRKDLNQLIESLLLEKDLSYLNPINLFTDTNENVKAFKAEVFEQLQDVYDENLGAEFLGTITRDVAKTLKGIYNDPNSKFVDRDFLQNKVRKFHYLPVDELDGFLKNASANRKHEISAVGYIADDKVHSVAAGRGSDVAVELEGYVTLAGNSNLLSGHAPTEAQKEEYADSGFPKDFYIKPGSSIPSNITALQAQAQMTMLLKNHINHVLDNIILDRSSFIEAEKRMDTSLKAKVMQGSSTRWNEFILDNWKPVALILGPSAYVTKYFDKDLEIRGHKVGVRQAAARDTISHLSKKYGMPVLNPLKHHKPIDYDILASMFNKK
jgi:hypothetical protein